MGFAHRFCIFNLIKKITLWVRFRVFHQVTALTRQNRASTSLPWYVFARVIHSRQWLSLPAAVGVAVVGFTNNVPVRLTSSSEELRLYTVVKSFHDYFHFFRAKA